MHQRNRHDLDHYQQHDVARGSRRLLRAILAMFWRQRRVPPGMKRDDFEKALDVQGLRPKGRRDACR